MDLVLRLAGTSALTGLLVSILMMAPDRSAGLSEPDKIPENDLRRAPVSSLAAEAIDEPGDVYYRAILDRPLFDASRRPLDPRHQQPVVSIPPNSEDNLPKVSLLGVMSGGSRTRVLVSIEGSKPVWLSEGEKIGGWAIISAGKDWLELATDKNTVRMELFE